MSDKLPAIATTGPIAVNDEQVELIKRTVAKGATADELALFLYQAKRTGLDPLARQIHCIKRGNAATIQTGIDGYRLIADRTGLYAGNDDPVYDAEGREHPAVAHVTVYKMVSGQRVAFTASARWNEYAPDGGQGFMWRKMPYLMLGKVAEALALRKAFPAELSGVYTNEEMDQANVEPPTSEPVVVDSVNDKPTVNLTEPVKELWREFTAALTADQRKAIKAYLKGRTVTEVMAAEHMSVTDLIKLCNVELDRIEATA